MSNILRSVNFPGWGNKSGPSSSPSTSTPQPQPPAASSSQAQATAPSPPSNTSPRRPPESKDQPLGRSFLGAPKSSTGAGGSPSSSAAAGATAQRPQIGGKGVFGHATGGKVGLGGKGMGMGKGGFKRHRKIMKDTVKGITKGDIRRLARRGGVKRLSAPIYEDTREAIKDRLALILKDCICYVEHRKAKTITVSDVIFALQRIGKPIYGFGERRNMFR